MLSCLFSITSYLCVAFLCSIRHWRFAKLSQFIGRMQNLVLDTCPGTLDGEAGQHVIELGARPGLVVGSSAIVGGLRDGSGAGIIRQPSMLASRVVNRSSMEETIPVSSLGVANPLGLFDRRGNVREWREDHVAKCHEAPNDGWPLIREGADDQARRLRGARRVA